MIKPMPNPDRSGVDRARRLYAGLHEASLNPFVLVRLMPTQTKLNLHQFIWHPERGRRILPAFSYQRLSLRWVRL